METDDSQMYLSFGPPAISNQHGTFTAMEKCIAGVESWLDLVGFPQSR